jgi:hypothetical protein
MSATARLALGASLGAFCAVLVLLGGPGKSELGANAVASVNGSQLKLAQYQRALRMFASEKRSAVTAADRSMILERMIEEELLLLHGVESGLVRNNPAVRAEAIRSVMASLMTELEARIDGEISPRQGRDAALAEYIGQLRNGAYIPGSAAGVAP